jgi:hypothetical protein
MARPMRVVGVFAVLVVAIAAGSRMVTRVAGGMRAAPRTQQDIQDV